MSIGGQQIQSRIATIVITGDSGNIPGAFTGLNSDNFGTLSFDAQLSNFFSWDTSTGILTIHDTGLLEISGVINAEAAQASAELSLVPVFDLNDGAGWVRGYGRKEVLTAIKPSQITWYGARLLPNKDSKIRLYFRATSGNIHFMSETLDPGGGLESLLPSAIFNILLHRVYEKGTT
jgi:hypothetical protein